MFIKESENPHNSPNVPPKHQFAWLHRMVHILCEKGRQKKNDYIAAHFSISGLHVQQSATGQQQPGKSLSHCLNTWLTWKLKYHPPTYNGPYKSANSSRSSQSGYEHYRQRSEFEKRLLLEVFWVDQSKPKIMIWSTSRGMWRMKTEITWAKAISTHPKFDSQIIVVRVMVDFQEQPQSEQTKIGKHFFGSILWTFWVMQHAYT